MRTALDPELLAEALGHRSSGPLPSVEELTALIAEVEVAGFQGSYQLDNELLGTAWYLHGVASASQASELYTPQRQQRAFQVSAHIFDLAMSNETLGLHDRLTLAFAAQVGYRRSNLDPNATSIFRRALPLLIDAVDSDNKPIITSLFEAERFETNEGGHYEASVATLVDRLPLLALRIGVTFLGLDSPQINRLTKIWLGQCRSLIRVLEVSSLTGTMYGPASEILRAVGELMRFMRNGDTTRISIAQSALESVLNLESGQGDHDARWVAAHLLPITGDLRDASVWSVLPPGTPPAVAQAFTVGQPSVLTLWPPQRDLLARDNANPLSTHTKRLLLSVPTSAGKTLMAQLMICAHLATERDSVCYVSPLRSLGREMRDALRGRLRVLNRELGADLPDRPTALDDLFGVSDPDVDVMTPERLMHALRRDPMGTLERYSLFIIDEVQLLAQPGRGFMLESLLTFLRETDARLVLLSGVLGNGAGLAQWLSNGTPDVLFSSNWRGPRQVHALLTSDLEWGAQTVTSRNSTTHPWRKRVPARALLHIRPAESIVRSLRTEVIGEKVFKIGHDQKVERDNGGTPFYADVAVVASILLRAGSLLMVVNQRDIARRAAEVIAKRLDHASGIGELETFLKERLGDQHPLLGCVRHGIGYHHAGLPTDVLNALEQALRDGQLLAIVATSTLTDGVNLPVRTVIISEITYEGQRSGATLDPARLLNAVGRAGRSGRETEGWIVLALNKSYSPAEFDKLTPSEADLQVRSTLFEETSINSLAETEALLAATADAVLQLKPGPAADFVSYVWFVLSSLEQISGVLTSHSLPDAIGGLLGLHQLDQDLRDRWTSLAQSTQDVFVATDSAARRRWNSAGTTIASAIEIDKIVKDVVAALNESDLDPWVVLADASEISLAQTLDVLASCDVFTRLLVLPEAQGIWSFKASPRGKVLDDVVDVDKVVRQWIGGASVTELGTAHLSSVSNASWRLEQMVDIISGAFEHVLSWTVGVVVEQANASLSASNSWIRLCSSTSSMLRYGVDTQQALGLLTGGVQSRRLAQRIGRWAHDNHIDSDELRNALDDLHIDGWRSAFEASPADVLDLLEFTRARRQSLLRELLESGMATVAVTLLAETRTEVQVSVRPSGATPAAYQIFESENLVATIRPGNHAAVQDVLDSGLDISFLLTASTLKISVRTDSEGLSTE